MNSQEYKPISNCLSLTVRKEHRLIALKNTSTTAFRISWKTLLYLVLLTVANIFV